MAECVVKPLLEEPVSADFDSMGKRMRNIAAMNGNLSSGTPLVAGSYSFDDLRYRQIFYLGQHQTLRHGTDVMERLREYGIQ
jgi:hypothetical protein